jgi:hypothetical protein
MEASFVEEVSGGSESVPRGASRALIGVIAGRRRRGPPPFLIEPTRHIGHIVLAFGRHADVTFTGVTIRHPGYPCRGVTDTSTTRAELTRQESASVACTGMWFERRSADVRRAARSSWRRRRS